MRAANSSDPPKRMTMFGVWLGITILLGDAFNLRADDVRGLPAAVESITVEEVKKTVEFLASDTLQGREAGAEGNYAAAAFLVAELKRTGLQPAGDEGGWHQHFRGNLRNIVGVWPGSDATLKDEFVLVGAHYDHVGFGNPRNSRGPIGYVHNGADDNASGCAALLELVQGLALLEPKPKRSLLIVFWDGEEQGLLGSKHFVSEPLRPLSQIRCVLNADMLGRLNDDGLQVQGWRAATGLRQLVAQANVGEMQLDFHLRYIADSDHWPFFDRGIPSLMLHSGKHDDYHRPTDDADKINFVGLRDAARFLLRLTVATAMADQLPAYREKLKFELPAQNERALRQRPSSEPRVVPGRLGVRFDSQLAKNRVLKLVGVEAGGSGAEAGLEVGDEIVHFAGHRVEDWPDFRTLVLTANSPVQVDFKRGNEQKSASVNLRGERVPIGLETRADDAEPHSLIVTSVIAGSPAEHAGLRAGQRIVGLDSNPQVDPTLLSSRLLAAPSEIVLKIEEHGRFRDLTLKRVDPP